MDSKNNHKLNAPFDHKFSEFKGVVIDGANVLTKGNRKDGNKTEFVIQRLTKLIQIVEALGWSALVGLKSKSYYYMISRNSGMPEEDKSKLRKMVETGVIDLIDDEEDD